MASQLFNNLTDSLATPVGSSDTTVSVSDGSKFTDLAPGDYTPAYLVRASDGALEIVHITGVSGNDLTVTRQAEGTDPLVFNSGDVIQVRPTRQSLLDLDASDMSASSATGIQSIGDALDQRVIYADSVGLLPASGIVSGQAASVHGVPFEYDGVDWLPSAGFVTPEAYGAVGDNVADDVSAWQSAIDSGVAIQPSDKTYHCSSLPDFSSGVNLLPSSAIIRVSDGNHSAANVLLAEAGGITITGTTIDTDTVSSVSVTGSPGAYSVTATVSDGTKFSVGDIIRIKNVLPGVVVPGSIPASRPVLGELRLGFFQMGELSVSGTNATLSGSGANTYLGTADLILIKGQVREIVSVDTESSFTISSALASDVSGLQYWYYMDNIAAGLASTSGTTVTFSSSLSLDFIEIGSLIAIEDASLRRVVSKDAGTDSIEVNTPIKTVSSKRWGAVDFGELHEGGWAVTDVSGNIVTWTNTSDYALPSLNFDSADVDIIKTRLTFSGSGVSVKSGQVFINDLALVGSGAGNGFDLNTVSASGKWGRATTNENVVVSGFTHGVWASLTSSFFGQGAAICGNNSRGVNATEGGQAWLQGATVNGNDGIGIFIGPGSYGRLANARYNGNSGDGLRMEVGASTWADFSYAVGNGGDGVLAVGGANPHLVGARLMVNGGDGFDGQNGGYGRASGALAIGNGNAGFRPSTGQIELNQANIIANDAGGLVVTGGHAKLNEGGVNGNSVIGVRGLETARVNINTCQITDQPQAMTASDESVIHGSGVGIADNLTDCTVDSGGKISLDSASATPTANVTLNTQTATFAYVASY